MPVSVQFHVYGAETEQIAGAVNSHCLFKFCHLERTCLFLSAGHRAEGTDSRHALITVCLFVPLVDTLFVQFQPVSDSRHVISLFLFHQRFRHAPASVSFTRDGAETEQYRHSFNITVVEV